MTKIIFIYKKRKFDIWKNLYELPLIENDKETDSKLLKLGVQNNLKINFPLLLKSYTQTISPKIENIFLENRYKKCNVFKQ